MCGIFFSCCDDQHIVPDDVIRDALRARGPDSLKIFRAQTGVVQADDSDYSESSNCRYLTWASSVLSLRGNDICVQPLIDPATGSVLCWNGEAWNINSTEVQGNDTEQVFQLMLNAADSGTQVKKLQKTCSADIVRMLTCVAGPYAFVFYHAPTSILYYGRDRLGRRSLVWKGSNSPITKFSISSLCLEGKAAVEVPTDGIHCLDLSRPSLMTKLIPWPTQTPVINKELPEGSHTIGPMPSTSAVADLTSRLAESIRLRVLGVPRYTVNSTTSSEAPSRVAILFSGGLDCTLLARIAHDVLPIDQPIDLLNVAFENPRTVRASTQSTKSMHSDPKVFSSPYEACPDRVTARSSFAELNNICSARPWRFVAVNVPYTETLAHRSTVIKLMSPHNTEMDLSISLALYFASRGQGLMTTSPSSLPVPYTTTSRVLLSGLGADELFGGYTRHAAAFTRSGFEGLTAELELDFARIGTRNLGRDDRVMAHWGREVRYPYLDEDFVAFALALPAWDKTGFRPDGRPVPKHLEGAAAPGAPVDRERDLDPAKMLLRLAAWRLGLRGPAAERKRAIQFGARTAKMETGRTKGTDVLVA